MPQSLSKVLPESCTHNRPKTLALALMHTINACTRFFKNNEQVVRLILKKLRSAIAGAPWRVSARFYMQDSGITPCGLQH